LRLQQAMKWLLLMTVAVSGAGCATTTTVGSPASGGAQRALAENVFSDASIESTLGAAVGGMSGLRER